jgi:hypothetical protein
MEMLPAGVVELLLPVLPEETSTPKKIAAGKTTEHDAVMLELSSGGLVTLIVLPSAVKRSTSMETTSEIFKNGSIGVSTSVGDAVGDTVVSDVGTEVGAIVVSVGTYIGVTVGDDVGSCVIFAGAKEGTTVGNEVGGHVAADTSAIVAFVGTTVGVAMCNDVGTFVASVGAKESTTDGAEVGADVVGEGVAGVDVAGACLTLHTMFAIPFPFVIAYVPPSVSVSQPSGGDCHPGENIPHVESYKDGSEE